MPDDRDMEKWQANVKRAGKDGEAATGRRPQRDPTRRSAARREVADLLAEHLGGRSDDGRVREARERHLAESTRAVDEERAAAEAEAGAALRSLTEAMQLRMQSMQTLAALPAGNFTTITVRKPFMIWAGKHSSAILDETHIDDDDSWAKVHVHLDKDDGEGPSTQAGERRASFWFMWQNDSDYFAVISAHTYVALNGYIRVGANGSAWNIVLAGPWVTNMWLRASLSWWRWWQQPQVSTELQNLTVTGVTLENGVLGQVHGERVNRVERLESGAEYITIPPRETVVFEVAISFPVGIEEDGGSVDFDFSSGDFRIVCPWMNILLLTPAP